MIELLGAAEIYLPILADTEVRRMVDRSIDAGTEFSVDVPIVSAGDQCAKARRRRGGDRFADCNVVRIGKGQGCFGANHLELGEVPPVGTVGADLHEAAEGSPDGSATIRRARVGRSPRPSTKVPVVQIITLKGDRARLAGAVILIDCHM